MEIKINIQDLTQNIIFKLIVAYLFILETIKSQDTLSKSIYKNIFVRLLTNILLFYILDFNMLSSLLCGLVFTTTTFITNEM
jgi:hypothetical protein